MRAYLDFEKPIAELEGKVEELRHIMDGDGTDIADEIAKIESKAATLLKSTYAKLTPWQKTQVARHSNRPHVTDYIKMLVEDFTPLQGDRGFADDNAIIGGLGRLRGRSVMLIGHEKGHDTETRMKHNFGMAKPEGYRKAIRLMALAERFGIPVVTLVDTAGAYPGKDAEERGQAEAIARSTEAGLNLKVPFVSVIIGEGGSGGAIALAAANKVLMLEHAIYSVISPEGCASILWRDSGKAQEAAEALKVTAQDLAKLSVIDGIISEPIGGAHREPKVMAKALEDAVIEALDDLSDLDAKALRAQRHERFLDIGRIGLA